MSIKSKALAPSDNKPESTLPVELEAVRSRIDQLDDQITNLIQQRLELVKEVVEIKEECKLPTIDLERERQVIARVSAKATDPAAKAVIEELYKKLFELSRHYQADLRS